MKGTFVKDFSEHLGFIRGETYFQLLLTKIATSAEQPWHLTAPSQGGCWVVK